MFLWQDYRLVDGATVWIQKQFHFSEVFGLVSQGILIKTYNCVRRNKQLSHFKVWLCLFLGGSAETGYWLKAAQYFGNGLNENMAGKACRRHIDATKLCRFSLNSLCSLFCLVIQVDYNELRMKIEDIWARSMREKLRWSFVPDGGVAVQVLQGAGGIPSRHRGAGGVLGSKPQQQRHRALWRACQQRFPFLGKGRWEVPRPLNTNPEQSKRIWQEHTFLPCRQKHSKNLQLKIKLNWYQFWWGTWRFNLRSLCRTWNMNIRLDRCGWYSRKKQIISLRSGTTFATPCFQPLSIWNFYSNYRVFFPNVCLSLQICLFRWGVCNFSEWQCYYCAFQLRGNFKIEVNWATCLNKIIGSPVQSLLKSLVTDFSFKGFTRTQQNIELTMLKSTD